MKPSIKLTVAALTLALLTSCTDAAGLQSSDQQIPNLWGRLTGEEANLVSAADAQVEQHWWKRFNDPVLDSLVQEALAQNHMLAIARARVAEAKAGRLGAESRLMPQLNATGSSGRTNQGYFTSDRAVTVHEIAVEASWELDIFGKNQARTASAQAIVESQEAERQAVQVALLSEVARNYFDLRNYERQIAITQRNLDTQNRTVEIIRIQLEGALASDFDVQRAAAQVSRTESLLPALRTAYDGARNRLQVLTGVMPGGTLAMLDEMPAALAPLDQQVAIAAPATVLAKRPDVRAAERLYAGSISARQAATAELFPSISLLGLYGVQDTSLMSASPWGLTASLVQPILNFGRIQSLIDAADARQQQAFASYQLTVLEAVEDMENALSSYLNEVQRNTSLANALAQNTKATELAREQYTAGYTGLLDVLVSERNLLDAESESAASDAKLRKDLVAIYAAAGGGWEESKAEETPEQNETSAR